MAVDLSSVTAGEVYGWWKNAVQAGDEELADIFNKLEMAILADRFEERIDIETRLLPLALARDVSAVQQ